MFKFKGEKYNCQRIIIVFSTKKPFCLCFSRILFSTKNSFSKSPTKCRYRLPIEAPNSCVPQNTCLRRKKANPKAETRKRAFNFSKSNVNQQLTSWQQRTCHQNQTIDLRMETNSQLSYVHDLLVFGLKKYV